MVWPHFSSSAKTIFKFIIHVIFVLRIEAECVSNCTGKLPIRYQSCDSCTKYVTCDSKGKLTTNTCIFGMVFDDTIKMCFPFFGTCKEYVKTSTTKATTPKITTTAAAATTRTTTDEATTTTSQKASSKSTPGITPPLSLPTKPSIAGRITVQSLYISIILRTPPCGINAPFYRSTPARSKIECGVLCNRDRRECWYFQLTAQKCLMYSLSLPPCNEHIYKYIGESLIPGHNNL